MTFSTLHRRTPLKSYSPLRRTPIRRVSRKQAARQRQLSQTIRRLIGERGNACELRLPCCTGRVEGSHHLRKRSQGRDDSAENLKLSCDACNSWVEDHPTAAWRAGFVVSRKREAMEGREQ